MESFPDQSQLADFDNAENLRYLQSPNCGKLDSNGLISPPVPRAAVPGEIGEAENASAVVPCTALHFQRGAP
jgi:hypothetical protein